MLSWFLSLYMMLYSYFTAYHQAKLFKIHTFALLLFLFGFLQSFEQTSEISDAVRKCNLLILIRTGVFQNLPNVHLRSFLLLDLPDIRDSMGSRVMARSQSTCVEEPDLCFNISSSSRHVKQRDGLGKKPAEW